MADDSTILDRVQELTWALVDEEINGDEMALLDSLLLSDDQARKRYMECMQLHAGLMQHWSAQTPTGAEKSASKSPVLGFLNAGAPPVSYDLPPAEDMKS